MLDAYRILSLLRQASIIQHQDALCRAACHQQTHSLFVESERIPGGIGQEMLQLFQRGIGHHLGDGLAVFARQIGQQTSDVALQRLTTGGAKNAASSGKGSGELLGKVSVFMPLS